MAQKTVVTAKSKNMKETQPEMKTYVIEREIPNAGKLTADELKGISQTTSTVLKEKGPEIPPRARFSVDGRRIGRT